MRALLIALALSISAPIASARDYAREHAVAAELADICTRDAGRMWGVTLCGPLIVVDPQTREAWANQADAGGVLTPNANGWKGLLPANASVANTSVEWSGTRWIMLIAPLPASEEERRVLVAHEAWHRIQGEIGFDAPASGAAHLDTERGRLLLRLELRALRAALLARGNARWRAARDALGFRAQRLAEFPETARGEIDLDRAEGLAAYTGAALGAGDPAAYAARFIENYDNHQAFTRAFAYATGPAYGLLLDDRDDSWRTRLGADAPADLLERALRRSRARMPDAAAFDRYGGPAIAAEEAARAEAQRAVIADYRARLAEGPRLVLPLQRMRMDFNPNQITPVEGLGQVYRTITLRDVWGELASTDALLISNDFSTASVAAPAADGLSGPGWSLQLAEGYRITGPDSAGVVSVTNVP